VTGFEALGVDFGGVIIDRVHEDRTSDLRADYTAARPVEGAFAAIARLVAGRFGDRVWVVSRCDEANEPFILDWLERRGFYTTTGVARERVYFCRQRDEKAAICRSLGITHFVDDRLEVLSHLVGTVPTLYLFRPRKQEVTSFSRVLPHVQQVRQWSDILDALLGGAP
jgi:hypothetical protein